MKERPASLLAWIYVGSLAIVLGISLLSATPSPQDDHFLYQRFIESLAGGRLDLSIPGFHGSDLFGFIIYVFTRSPIAQIYGLFIAAALLPLAGFLAGRSIFKEDWHGIVLASIVALMPFISFVSLRGWTGPGYWLLMLLTIWSATTKRWWLTGILFALAILTKPFAIVLLPLLFVLNPSKEKNWERHRAVFMGGAIVALYLLIQYVQAGRIFVGAHADLSEAGALQGPTRILLNIAHGLQILFSVHNYYYPNPALTGPGNMMHTTPVIVFLGLFAMLAPDTAGADRRLMRSLLLGAIIGIGMNALLDHMDHFYMEASILLFTIAALPMLRRFPLWIPIVLATLHFQWFYFYLQYRPGFLLDWRFILVPGFVDFMLIEWCVTRQGQVRRILSAVLTGR
ncbi:MAG: hypothetical protein Greene041619_47 [Candidatus Peregrinibacteria bacterium Greene0416_19]|nr:MAG: hypothetical protein Greene041619_47 [Candidatus Peregrinibacteria bacterium Greene0416_19]